MSRNWDHDEDSRRLPEGMTRVGYDADTQVYTFKDKDGNFYHGEPGNCYGRLRPQMFRNDNAAPLQTSAVAPPPSITIPSPTVGPSSIMIPSPTDIANSPMTEFPDHMTTTNQELESASGPSLTDRIVAPMQALRRTLTQKTTSKAPRSTSIPENKPKHSRWYPANNRLQRALTMVGQPLQRRISSPPTYGQSQRQYSRLDARSDGKHAADTIDECDEVDEKLEPKRRGTE